MGRVIFVTLQQLGHAAGAGQELNPFELVLGASLVVKVVLLVLVLMSALSWFIIGAKLVRFDRAARQSEEFLEVFWNKELGAQWSPERLEAIYARARSVEESPIARVFHAGYVELARVVGAAEPNAESPHTVHQPLGDIDNVERALRRASVAEVTSLESKVPFLATTGSTAPFIGLFGTVWGIMNSFISIGGQHAASLDVVAPGIAEALIATAIGLAAAIPAVMAYNYFVRRIHVLESEMAAFASDYLNIVRRHFLPS